MLSPPGNEPVTLDEYASLESHRLFHRLVRGQMRRDRPAPRGRGVGMFQPSSSSSQCTELDTGVRRPAAVLLTPGGSASQQFSEPLLEAGEKHVKGDGDNEEEEEEEEEEVESELVRGYANAQGGVSFSVLQASHASFGCCPCQVKDPSSSSLTDEEAAECLGVVFPLLRAFHLLPSSPTHSWRRRLLYLSNSVSVYGSIATIVSVASEHRDSNTQNELLFVVVATLMPWVFVFMNLMALMRRHEGQLSALQSLMLPMLRPSTRSTLKRTINRVMYTSFGIFGIMYLSMGSILPYFNQDNRTPEQSVLYDYYGCGLNEALCYILVTLLTLVNGPILNVLSLCVFGVVMYCVLVHCAAVQELAHYMACCNDSTWRHKSEEERDTEVERVLDMHTLLHALLRVSFDALQWPLFFCMFLLFVGSLLMVLLVLQGEVTSGLTLILTIFTFVVISMLGLSLWVLGSIDRQSNMLPLLATHMDALSVHQQTRFVERFKQAPLVFQVMIPVSSEVSARLVVGALSVFFFVIGRGSTV